MDNEGPVPFAANEVRLSPRECLVAAILIAAVLGSTPLAWRRFERLVVGPDYRLPYRLSDDYWTYQRACRLVYAEGRIPVIGDSVVWGHYVSHDQTLSHHLDRLGGGPGFVNLGVDGIHPAAMAGLLDYYGGAIAARRVVLHCNLVWTASEKQDLSASKEFAFNHPDLVPQFLGRPPCYRKPVSARLAVAIGHHLPFVGWSRHLRIAYFDSKDIPSWTIDHPYANPLGAVTLQLPSPAEMPSPRPDARPWTERGLAPFPAQWVELDTSIQWRSFRRAVEILQRRGNRVFVVLGPFNEHMLTPGSLTTYQQRKRAVQAWLEQRGVPYYVPEPLPSALYADASHPLAEGYALLAKRIIHDEAFARFIQHRPTEGAPK